MDDSIKTIVGKTAWDAFSQPLLNKTDVKSQISLLERLMGRTTTQAAPMTNEIIKDLTTATEYPPAVEGTLLPSEEVVAIANELCDYVGSLNAKANDEDI